MAIPTDRNNMPFDVKDCTLITRMAGVDTALNLRELRERLQHCPLESLFHHFCETVIRPTFDDPEFRNDFAIWAARHLQDRALAERLGILNPYEFASFEDLRQTVIDIIDDRLAEVPYVPWVKQGNDFRFMRAVTVIFDTGLQLHTPDDLVKAIPEMSLGSIYYHYVEARRRTDNGDDDFTAWLVGFGDGPSELIAALSSIDFYFMSLYELQDQLEQAVRPFAEESTVEQST
ncbi:hypothetical protein GF377_05315 [candidate division GN15 bacterium]|nr:hypothetical protein [candidate division GN15 bacterium]